MSIYRIVKSMSSKLMELNDMHRHNFFYTKRRTLGKMEATSKDDMEKIIKFYNSTQNSCECGDNKLISSILDIDIPCYHRCYLGCEFPEPPEIIFNIDHQWNELEVDYNPIHWVENIDNVEPFTKRYAK